MAYFSAMKELPHKKVAIISAIDAGITGGPTWHFIGENTNEAYVAGERFAIIFMRYLTYGFVTSFQLLLVFWADLVLLDFNQYRRARLACTLITDTLDYTT